MSVASKAASAYPDSIDRDWDSICTASQHWNSWWSSTKPKKLRQRNHSPLPRTQSLSVSGHQHQQQRQDKTQNKYKSNTNNNNTVSRNIAHRFNKGKPVKTFCNICQRSGHSNNDCRYKNCDCCGKRGHSSVDCHNFCSICQKPGHSANNCRNRNCDYCGKRGHSSDVCRKRLTDERRNLKCNYCSCLGHTEDDCYTKVTEKRQEDLFRSILAGHTQRPSHYMSSTHNQNSVPVLPTAHQPTPWNLNSGSVYATSPHLQYGYFPQASQIGHPVR